MARNNSPWDVFVALHGYSHGTASWDEVMAIAQDVQYERPQPSPWGDIDLGVDTFNDAVWMAKSDGAITDEQEAQLMRIGHLPGERSQ